MSKSNMTLPTHCIKKLEQQTRRCDKVADFLLVRASHALHVNQQMHDANAYANLLFSVDNLVASLSFWNKGKLLHCVSG
jgi:hypothetical protein